jgi:hypothetical protein
MKIKRVRVPPLVGRREAARILGVLPENMPRMAVIPEPLQDRGIEGFDVSQTPLWPRAEIEQVRDERSRVQALLDEKRKAKAGA